MTTNSENLFKRSNNRENEDQADRLLGEVAEDYFQRVAQGENPSIGEYATSYPEIADLIRDTFAAVVFINQSSAGDIYSDGRNLDEYIDRVATFTGQGFTAPEDAEPLLRFGPASEMVVMKPATRSDVIERHDADSYLQGAVLHVGKGRLAVFGEASMFTAQVAGPRGGLMGMNSPLAPDNQQFLLNVMHWLSHRL